MTKGVLHSKALRRSNMRIWLSTVLFALSAVWVAYAQPPASPPESEKLVIKPGGKGVTPVGAGSIDPLEKPGFLIIRPNGKGAIGRDDEPRLPSPSTTRTIATTPLSSAMNVPPPGPEPKEAKDGKPIFDYWFAVGVDGQRVGYVNWSAKEVEQKDKRFAVGVRYLNLTLSRFGNAVKQWGEESTVETLDGDVLITSIRQESGKDQSLAITGVVNKETKTLRIKGEGAAATASDTPWPGGVVGLVREPKLFRELKLKVGESFDYLSYIPTVNRVVKTMITFVGEETRTIWPNTPARKLLQFVTKPAPIGKIRLPSSTTWVDAETHEPLLMETDFPALGGRLTFVRTTREAATAPVTRPVEVFNHQSIRLDREIPGIHGKGSVVYKVTVLRDDEPETVFATDSRQQLKNFDEKTKSYELHISARHGAERNAAPEPAPGKEFTSSNYFINWDNDGVKAIAAKAMIGLSPSATDWEKALAIERWVNRNMKAFEFSQALATADNVAKTLSGDCTEYAMLSAAMCRAVGVPSRTALGVVYAAGKDGKPFLAYHMWFEVYAEGQWLPLDATLGMGGVGPGHVKITDHSWHEEKSYAPLLPVLRSLAAKPGVSVLKVVP